VKKVFKRMTARLVQAVFLLVGLPLYILGAALYILMESVESWSER